MYQSNLLKEYYAEKSRLDNDTILLWRIGDFDEAFGQDATCLAAVLGFTVTTRATGGDNYPMVGYPTHAREIYLKQLRQLGIPYAICERDDDGHRHITEKYSYDDTVWGY